MTEDRVPAEDGDWPHNYFNYFTEIEEHFQRARGTGLFLLSPLDWALIENWKNSAIPLSTVLKGIDEAFEKWRSRKIKRRFKAGRRHVTVRVTDDKGARAYATRTLLVYPRKKR